MFLYDKFSKENGIDDSIIKMGKDSTTYSAYFTYWREQLFERVMRLFVWTNTGDVPAKEIEQRLLLSGRCGIAKLPRKKTLTAFYGSFSGVTEYDDEYTNFLVRCPIYSGTKTIGKDVVVINNNAIRNSVYPLVHHYATLLAHAEVTIVDAMIAARDAGGIPVATTEKQRQSIAQYQKKVYNGEYGCMTDIGNIGLNYVGVNRGTSQNIEELIIARDRLLKEFYSDIGVRSAFEKKNNSVTSEVQADTSLLLLNLSDMLDARKKGAEEVNELFGTNWSVDIAEELKYITEESEGNENEKSARNAETSTEE